MTAETVRLRLQSGETALLDRLTGLRRADFSGSLCYDELLAWAEAHPEVDTRYTVALPDGGLWTIQRNTWIFPALTAPWPGDGRAAPISAGAEKSGTGAAGCPRAALGCFGLSGLISATAALYSWRRGAPDQ